MKFLHKNQQLNHLLSVESALIQKNENNYALNNFWKGLARDTDGSMAKYNGIFLYYKGIQAKPDIKNNHLKTYIKKSILMKKKFIEDVESKTFYSSLSEFAQWLRELHSLQAYKGRGGAIKTHSTHFGISTIQTPVVLLDVIPLAKKYNDSYTNKGKQLLYLPGISAGGFSFDIWNDLGTHVIHSYPHPIYFEEYMREIQSSLYKIIILPEHTSLQTYCYAVAEFYQYAVTSRMFELVNHSFFTNITNCLIERIGLKPISQGIIDFIAMRLQPENFKKFFFDEVMHTNMKHTRVINFD